MIYFEDIVKGTTTQTGSFEFTLEEIDGFNTKYNLPYDEENPVAHTIHVGAIWMQLMVNSRKVDGEKSASGVSCGFLKMEMRFPIKTGDTVTFYATVMAKRELASRPTMGLTQSLNQAINQDGQEVWRFTGQGFIGKRPQ
jgi:acyl dehydratase